jgi:transposase
VLVSMHPRPLPEVPEETVVVARAAFRNGSLAMRVRDELGVVFEDGAFMDAFAVRGKPGISPGQLAMVTVLQFAENLTDRQAADAVRGRIDWKYCLGLELTDPGFDFSVLSQFRSRLVAHDLQGMAFEMLLDRLVALGLVKARGRQRTDDTHVVAAVRDLNRLEMVGETLRAALEALAAAAPQWLAGHIDAEVIKRYGARIDEWRLPKDQAGRGETRRSGRPGRLPAPHGGHRPAGPALAASGSRRRRAAPGVDPAVHPRRVRAGGDLAERRCARRAAG